ncbi:MAG: vWA domain-containing protein [Methylococcaceae bacterium]
MNIAFEYPWILSFTSLGLLPLFFSPQKKVVYSSLLMLPKDPLSQYLLIIQKLITAAVIILLVLSLARPFTKQQTLSHVGEGAQIVLLLDHSASMNNNFSGRYFGGRPNESKVASARKLLMEFVASQNENFYGMIAFSTAPIYTMPLSRDKEAILSAIRASKFRGRGVTNIAPALAMGVNQFQELSTLGSRVIMLVSDGAARIESETQVLIEQLFKQSNVILYWIYLRDKKSPSLTEKPKNANETTAPEYFLNKFFQSMETPYQAFEANDSKSLERAFKEIAALETKPIEYQQVIPRHNLVHLFYLLAVSGVFILLFFNVFEKQKLTC